MFDWSNLEINFPVRHIRSAVSSLEQFYSLLNTYFLKIQDDAPPPLFVFILLLSVRETWAGV